jgi:hypothetical protein
MKRKESNGSKRRPAVSRVPLTIRLPGDVVAQVDAEREGRDVPVSRNIWLFEAVVEKLRRHDTGGRHGTQ